MQIIFENKDERSDSREVDLIDTIICAERVGKHIEREFVRRFGIRRSRIWISREIFVRIKGRSWERR